MTWTRPVPAPDVITQPYWDATKRDELLVEQCKKCGYRQHYPRGICTNCAGDVEWVRCSGKGVVHTYTVIHTNKSMGGDPYVVAMIDLEEGPRMMSNITDVHHDDVRIGMPVEVHFAETDQELKIPLFRPAG